MDYDGENQLSELEMKVIVEKNKISHQIYEHQNNKWLLVLVFVFRRVVNFHIWKLATWLIKVSIMSFLNESLKICVFMNQRIANYYLICKTKISNNFWLLKSFSSVLTFANYLFVSSTTHTWNITQNWLILKYIKFLYLNPHKIHTKQLSFI